MNNEDFDKEVAILLLLDYVLQSVLKMISRQAVICRNPCFIRLCFAILYRSYSRGL